MANTIDKVRILLVGDSGVGKTCLTHLIAHGESLTRPGWTVGCNIEVKLHDYKEGTPHQKEYFVELFDVGGSLSHKNTRSVFYTPTNGIILVHDLTNRKSHANLRGWLQEILQRESKDAYKAGGLSATPASNDGNSFDPEEFIGIAQIPILVMGTKLDLVDERRQPKAVQKAGGIAEQCGAEEIWLNCRDPCSLAAGTTDAVKLSRFFDRVIEKKHLPRDTGHYGAAFAAGRRYNVSSSTAPTTVPYTTAYHANFSTHVTQPSLLQHSLKTTGNILMQSAELQ